MRKTNSKFSLSLEKHVQNQGDMDKLIENIFHKIEKKETSPELWIAIFVLQFANLEDYLKQIIRSVILQATRDKKYYI